MKAVTTAASTTPRIWRIAITGTITTITSAGIMDAAAIAAGAGRLTTASFGC
jgi:hypothetical protein